MRSYRENKGTRTDVLSRMVGDAVDYKGEPFKFSFSPALFGAFEVAGETPREAMVLAWLLHKMTGSSANDDLSVEFTKYSVIRETGMRWRAVIASLDALMGQGLVVYSTRPCGTDVKVSVGVSGENLADLLRFENKKQEHSRPPKYQTTSDEVAVIFG